MCSHVANLHKVTTTPASAHSLTQTPTLPLPLCLCHTHTLTHLSHTCLSGVYTAASERYYKVAAEALRVCERLVPVLRADVEEPVDAAIVPVAQVGFVICYLL